MTRFLVITANTQMCRALRRALAPFGEVHCEASAERAAAELLQAYTWAGFVVGADVPDRLQAELIEQIKLLHPLVPVVVVVDTLGHHVTLDARTGPPCVEYLEQRVAPNELLRLVRDALTRPHRASEVVDWLVWSTCRPVRLSGAEEIILRAHFEGFDAQGIAATRRVCVDTVRKQIKAILRKLRFAGRLVDLCDAQRQRLASLEAMNAHALR